MADIEDDVGLWYYVIMIGSAIAIGIIVYFVTGTFLSSAQTNPEANITITEHVYNGKLGMVTYEHGWFGIGTIGTTLSFQNETDVIQFKFNQDLPVEIGKNYTVNYEIKDVIYYGIDNTKLFSSWYQNRTEIIPKNILLGDN
jgi:hypothetical protein